MTASFTRETMRKDIAEMIGEEPEAIGFADNLLDLGLDSMRLMNLLLLWQERGVDLEFSELAESFTIDAWWRAIEARRGGAGTGAA